VYRLFSHTIYRNINLPSVPESIVSLHVLQGYDHTSPINYRKQVILGLRGRVEPVVLAPRESRSIFSTSRSISADGTTAWTLTLSSSSRSRYRFTHSSGTAPALRTDRSLTPSGHQIQVAVNSNGTVTMTSNTSGEFTAVQVGDELFVPGTSTGDAAGSFDELNTGFWVVLSKTGSTVLQLARPSGATFEAVAETVTVSSNSHLLAFSAAGVRVGDKAKVSAGFATSVLQTYVVDRVTPAWFEVVATGALPVSATATPGSTGILFYPYARRLVSVVTDQAVRVTTNGAAADVEPFAAGDPDGVGMWRLDGTVVSLTVENLTDSPAEVKILSGE